MLTGENGLIAKSKNAVDSYNEEGQNELDKINELYSQIEVATGGTVTLSMEDLKTLVQSMVQDELEKDAKTSIPKMSKIHKSIFSISYSVRRR